MGKMKFDKFVPEARFDKYYIMWIEGIPKNSSGGIVGVIRNPSNEKIEINIEIDNRHMISTNNRTCCMWINADDFYKSVVVLSSAFFNVLKDNPEMEASIWHELGHFHTMHYFENHFIDGSSNKYRADLFEKGEITPEEEAADLFELYYAESSDTIKAFNWLIKRRRTDFLESEGPNKDRAVRELCMRKRKIASYDNREDQIVKRLCEICGVSNPDDL